MCLQVNEMRPVVWHNTEAKEFYRASTETRKPGRLFGGEGGITQTYSLRPSGHRHFIPALSRAKGARLEHGFLSKSP